MFAGPLPQTGSFYTGFPFAGQPFFWAVFCQKAFWKKAPLKHTKKMWLFIL
jgi:hypothetical protein